MPGKKRTPGRARDGTRDPAPERKPFLVRLPIELHEALRTSAAEDLRSVNGQVEFLLREALRRRGRRPSD